MWVKASQAWTYHKHGESLLQHFLLKQQTSNTIQHKFKKKKQLVSEQTTRSQISCTV